MKTPFATGLIAFGALFAACALEGQGAPAAPAAKQSQEDKEIAALRKDLRAQRKQYIAANLALTADEAAKFWPIYEQYAFDISKLMDRRVATLKELGASRETMTSEQAVAWIQKLIQEDKAMVDLRLRQIPIVAKVLPGKKAAAFFNLDRRTQMMIELDLPLKP